jgi:2-polyprenyl-3-methyl-5-hydroxy-6-metoxy-1,4-benzoquinol methylase
MLAEKIKKFYSELHFPGRYTWEDISFYNEYGIHNIYLKEIDKVLQHGIDVLDIGCGTGLVSNLFASRYKSSFTALDFSDSIDYAQKFAKDNSIKNVNWVKKDFLQFNTEKQYDVIICCGVLHHIPKHEQALATMKRLLKPNGILVLAVYNKYGKILKKLFKIDYKSDILYQDQENNPFELSFTNKQVLDMCKDLKFKRSSPSIRNYLVDSLAWTNSKNGGLVLYIFNKEKIS